MGFRKFTVAVMLGCFLITSTNVAFARVVGTDQYLSATDRGQQLARVVGLLDREDVRGQLVALGVDPLEAKARVAALSDQELNLMTTKLDQLPAGGDGLLVVLGIVFVVLIVLEFLGVTHIFTRHT